MGAMLLMGTDNGMAKQRVLRIDYIDANAQVPAPDIINHPLLAPTTPR